MGTSGQRMEVVQHRGGLLDGGCLYLLKAWKNDVIMVRSLKV